MSCLQKHPLIASHALVATYSEHERPVPVHTAVSYHEQPAAKQVVLVLLTEQAPGMPEQDPLSLPQPHSCRARQVPRVTLPEQALPAVMQRALLHAHSVCAAQADWL